jgi:hypothetical protein
MINSWVSAATRIESPARLAVLCLALAGCGPSRPPPEPVGVSNASEPKDAPSAWAFDSLDARPVSSEATRGKPTVLAFVTTDNLGSQAQVNYLVAMAKHDADRVNYAVVAMHPRKDRELVELYKGTLGVTFPVALVGDASLSGGGPFAVEHVPTVVVLDRAGRLAWRATGLAKPADIRPHLNGR